MGSPVASFTVEQLRASAERHAAASDSCVEAREALSAHGIQPAMVGSVPAAAAFHAVLMHVLGRQGEDAGAERVRRAELAGRAMRTAGLGAGLVGDTATLARGATVAPVASVPGGG